MHAQGKRHMKNKFWYIKRVDIFSAMSDADLEQLSQVSSMCGFKRGEIIYFPEEPSEHVYLLKEGKVKISRVSEDGREIILEIIGQGEIFGELSLFGEEARSAMAEAIADSTICNVRREEFERFLRLHSELAFRIMKLVGFRRTEIESRMEELAFLPVPARIAGLLARFAKKYGVVEGGEVKIGIGLTHREIAYLVGASRETVTDILNRMKGEGIIRTSFRTITILDMDALTYGSDSRREARTGGRM